MKRKEISIPILDPQMLEAELLQSFDGLIPPFLHNFSMAFHINRIEDYIKKVKVPRESSSHPYRLSVYKFIFLTEGQSKHTKGLNNYELRKGTFFIVPPYEITTDEFTSEDSTGFYCYFSMDLLSFHFKVKDLLADFPFLNFNSNPVITLKGDSIEVIQNLIVRLETEYKKDKDCRPEVLRAYLLALFVEITPFINASSLSSDNEDYVITDLFKKALTQNITVNQKTEEYARMLKIQPKTLNRSLRNTTGKKASELILEMILLESKVLLKQTSLSISEISYKLGQNHISNFVRLFKAGTGMSPGEYRNSLKSMTDETLN